MQSWSIDIATSFGDSVDMVLHGLPSTLGVTLDMMIMHAKAVRGGLEQALMVVDLPQAGGPRGDGCHFPARGIPIMAHIGLTQQAVNAFGGCRVQGRGEDAERIRRDAVSVAQAGAFSLVLERAPEQLARRTTGETEIPTVGIGASPACQHIFAAFGSKRHQ
ncbi:hypothetical protein AU467_18725 [Mesorhizobium loti]|uniref:3-methyl-2-oxobutanoate hydroxymethyltransferase n=1 Tax=Rhizobium loti TaxID=381 RepID=A0A101KU01_RHILI|nr:hypothetical protein AU467_18725 [Mesorhizobium loti]